MKSHLIFIIIPLVCFLFSCSGQRQKDVLDRADVLMETRPDSALILLKGIDEYGIGSKAEKARFALLVSMALDKNYVDTTTFDVLQPAIDYYLDHGDADEKLRTYYYQGRIYQNRGEVDKALDSFLNGIESSTGCSDSLTLVRAFVSQAYIHYVLYDFESYVDNNLRAAEISGMIPHKDYEFECLINALNGSILLNDKIKCDSILELCDTFDSLSDRQKQSLLWQRMVYTAKYGTTEEIVRMVSDCSVLEGSDPSWDLNIASAYNKLGKNFDAKKLLDRIESSNVDYDTLKYESIRVYVLKDLGEYQEALSVYEEFSRKMNYIDNSKFNHKLQLINEKHSIELEAQKKAKLNVRIIWGGLCGCLFLIMIIIVLLLFSRSNRMAKILAIQKAKNLTLENEKLKTTGEMLALENKNLQLERDKRALEAENLVQRVETLENESESLKTLIESQKELPTEVQQAIKVRIEMLNALLAGYITSNEQYEKPYEKWVKQLTDDTAEFMNSNRLAFQASHPQFISYFEDHDLTTDEINYVCLYAIGLRGKEVGNYMKKRSHVNTSSTIRKKLGIDKHETNIGIYVRRLLKDL